MNFKSMLAVAALIIVGGHSANAQETQTETQRNPEAQVESLATDDLSYGMTDEEFTIMSSRSARGERFARRVVGEIIGRVIGEEPGRHRGGYDDGFDGRFDDRDHRDRRDDDRWGRPRARFVCYAQNRRGEIFRARGTDRHFVQDRAMEKCERFSRRCRPLGCERR